MRNLHWIAIALLAACTGCMELDQKLIINENGSGKLIVEYSISEQAVTQTKAMFKVEQELAAATGEQGGPASTYERLLLNPDERAIRQAFAAVKDDGILIEKLETRNRTGEREVKLTIAFDDIAKAAQTPLLPLGAFSLQKTAAGDYVLARPAASGVETPRFDDAARQSLDELLSGFKARVEVRPPSRVIETDAASHTEQRATWSFEYNRDYKAPVALQKSAMRVVFAGQGLKIREF